MNMIDYVNEDYTIIVNDELTRREIMKRHPLAKVMLSNDDAIGGKGLLIDSYAQDGLGVKAAKAKFNQQNIVIRRFTKEFVEGNNYENGESWSGYRVDKGREIKFRGNSLVTKEQVFGHLFYFDDGRYFISPKGTVVEGDEGEYPSEYYLRDMKCIEIEPETVSQYIGLKDKNDVEIYEGDILKNSSGAIGYVVYLIQEAGFVVVLKRSDYRLGHRNTNESYDQMDRHEIIGNIYENPELL